MSFIANALNNLPISRANVVTITTSGTYSPAANVRYIWVEVQGGGGSGGNALATGANEASVGAGGSAGGYAARMINNPASATVTIGAAGSNSDGGSTSYVSGSINMVANGGPKGGNGPARDGNSTQFQDSVAGGGATGGTINIRGGYGGIAFIRGNNRCTSGAGGSSKFGAGARPRIQNSEPDAGVDAGGAEGFGSGGGGPANGQNQSQRNGTDGRSGIVVITEFLADAP